MSKLCKNISIWSCPDLSSGCQGVQDLSSGCPGRHVLASRLALFFSRRKSVISKKYKRLSRQQGLVFLDSHWTGPGLLASHWPGLDSLWTDLGFLGSHRTGLDKSFLLDSNSFHKTCTFGSRCFHFAK